MGSSERPACTRLRELVLRAAFLLRAGHGAVAAAAATAALLVCAPVAHADDAQSSVLAAQLFKDARADMALEDWKSAEAKLAASHKLVPAMGTLLNLAVCQARLGKTASAYHNFTEVAREAQNSGRADRLELASSELAKIVPLLSDAVIHVAANVQTLPGLAVTIDGTTLPPPLYESRVNLDPGTHLIAATATGKKPWQTSMNLAPKEHSEVTVPLLANKPFDPNEVKVSLAQADKAAKHQTLRTAGFVLLGVGAASVATAVGFGIAAKIKMGQVHCNSTPDGLDDGGFKCTAAQSEDSSTANTDATIANVTFGAGAALGVLGGIFLYLARDSGPSLEKDDADEEDARLRWNVTPGFDPHGGGLRVGRAF